MIKTPESRLTQIGPYVILALLGRGGMAEVYKVKDERDQSIQALKKIFQTDPVHIRRFRREFRAMQRVSHPGLVKVYAFGFWQGHPYFTMEYVEGIDLSQAVWNACSSEEQTQEISPEALFKESSSIHKNDRSLPRPDSPQIVHAVSLVAQVCQPLAHVHEALFVHRDLKPSNILVTRDGCIKLMDFGIVRDLDTLDYTHIGTIVGTAAYMSPEQGLGHEIDIRSDLYSLGVILYELITGERPFQGASLLEILRQHVDAAPIPPCHLNPAISPPLERLVLKLLDKEPGRRVQSARALERELKAIITDTAAIEINESSLTSPARLFRPSFAGRHKDLALLLERFEMALKGRGSLVWLHGELGVGKSRLLQELHNRLRLRHFHFWKGNAIRGEPMSVFHDIFTTAFATLKRDDTGLYPIQTLGKWGKIIGRICPDISSFPFVQAYVKPAALSPTEEKLRLFETARELFFQASQNQPLILCLEDLHWADDLSLDLFNHLVRTLLYRNVGGWIESEAHHEEGPKVLILATYRDEEISPSLERLKAEMERWNVAARDSRIHHSLALKRLSEEEIASMTASMMGMPVALASLTKRLMYESEGNPLFVQEIMKSMVAEKILTQGPKGWQISVESSKMADQNNLAESFGPNTFKIDLSPSIRAIITQRISGLSDQARDVLSYAAVIGREFSFDLLQKITDIPEDLLLDICDELLKEGVILESKPKEEIFCFYHDKLRELLYEHLLPRRRRRLHQKIGEEIESINAHPKPCEILSHHFLMADMEQKALPYLVQAGDHFRESYSNAEAIGCYTQALSICQKLNQENESAKMLTSLEQALLRHRGEVLDLIGKHNDARLDYEMLVQKAIQSGDRSQEALGIVMLGSLAMKQGDLAMAEAQTKQGIEIFTLLNDLIGVVHSLNDLGDIRKLQDQYTESLTTYEEALRLSQKINDKREETRSLIALANLLVHGGELDKAIEISQQAILVAQMYGNRSGIARSMNALARAHMQKGNYQEAAEFFQASLSIKEEIGDRMGTIVTSANLGCIAHLNGKSLESFNRLDSALKMAQDIGARWAEPALRANIGNVLFDLGIFAQAEEILKEGQRLAEIQKSRDILSAIFFTLGQVQEATGRLDEAFASFTSALKIAREVDRKDIYVFDSLKILSGISEIDPVKRNDFVLAQREKILNEAMDYGDPAVLAEVHLCLGQVFATMQTPPSAPFLAYALEHSSQAQCMAKRYHLPWILWKALGLTFLLHRACALPCELFQTIGLEVLHEIADQSGIYRESLLNHPEVEKWFGAITSRRK